METIIYLYFIPNLVVGILLGVSYVNTFRHVYRHPENAASIEPNPVAEFITTLLSPAIGFAMLFEDETYRDLKIHWLGAEEVQMIIMLYLALIVIYWVLSRQIAVLQNPNRNFIFTFITACLLLITLVGAVLTLYSDGYLTALFPGLGFPVIAIFLNLILYTYRLFWAKSILNIANNNLSTEYHENN